MTASRNMSILEEFIFFFLLAVPCFKSPSKGSTYLLLQSDAHSFLGEGSSVHGGITVQINLGCSWHNSLIGKPALLMPLGRSIHTVQTLLVLQDPSEELHFVIKSMT